MRLWIVSSLARLLLVIWAPVGDVSVLVSTYFAYQNNGRANACNNCAWGVRNTLQTIRKATCGATLSSQRNREKSRLRTKWYVKYVGPNSQTRFAFFLTVCRSTRYNLKAWTSLKPEWRRSEEGDVFMRQASHKVRLAVRMINIKQFGRFAGEQEVKRLSISTRLKYKMSELHQTRRCTYVSPHRQTCRVWRRSEERFSRFVMNKPTDRRRFFAS